MQVDTSNEEQVEGFFQALPHLDILCSNAALYVFNEAENITADGMYPQPCLSAVLMLV